MADLDETISTYLTAITVEGKTPKTIHSYANSLDDFRRVGKKLGLPNAVEDYQVEHVYRFLGALRERGASAGYQHRRHREVKAFFSWCRRMGQIEGGCPARRRTSAAVRCSGYLSLGTPCTRSISGITLEGGA